MKKFLIVVVLLAAVFVLLVFVLLPQIVSQSEVQNYLKEKIRERAGDRFEVQKISVGFFPSAFVEVRGLKVYPSSGQDRKPLFEARRAKLYLRILPLFFKQFQAKHLALDGAAFYWELPGKSQSGQAQTAAFLSLSEISGSMRNLSFRAPSRFKLKGVLYGTQGSSFLAEGQVRMSLEKLNLKLMEASVRFDIQNILLEHLVRSGVLGADVPVQTAELDLKGSLDLKPDTQDIAGSVSVTASKITLKESGQIPAAVSLTSQLKWTRESRVLALSDSQISGPGLKGTAFGTVSFLGEPQMDLSFRLAKLDFDDLEKNVLARLAGPKKWELLGEGSGSVILKGTPSKLLVHVDSDLTQAGVRIESLASKPAGRLLTFSLQSYISGSRASEGEFNGRFGDMSVKGAIEKMDLESWIGEINFITNKFPLAEWNDLLPVLQNLKLSGNAKVVTHLKGSFRDPKSLKYSAHVTLDQAGVQQNGQALFDGLSGSLDAEPDKLAVQESKLLFGSSDLALAGEIRDYAAPFFQIRLTSSNLLIEDLTALAERLGQFKLQPVVPSPPLPVQTSWLVSEAYAAQPVSEASPFQLPPVLYRAKGNVDFNLAQVSWSGRQLQSVTGKVAWNQGDLTVDKAWAKMGRGEFFASGGASWKGETPRFNAHLETLNAPVETLSGKKFLSGLLDSTADYRGFLGSSELMESSLQGAGTFHVRSGQIRGFSLLGALSLLPSLVLGSPGKDTGATDFDSLSGQFQIAQRKMQFTSMDFQSKIAVASAQGTIGFDQTLHFRGTLELAPGVGGILEKALETGEPLRFPLEVTGTVEEPRLNVTQALIGSSLVTSVLGKALGGKKSSSSGQAASTAAQLISSFLGDQ